MFVFGGQPGKDLMKMVKQGYSCVMMIETV